MDDLTMLRKVRAAEPGTSAAETTAARNTPLTAIEAAGRPAAGRAARRRIWVPVVAAAAAVVAGTGVLTLAPGGSQRGAGPVALVYHDAALTAALSGPGSVPARWSRLPSAPIAARNEYAAVWTGKEMIVWGGYSWNGHFPIRTNWYKDGAAYNPATRTWKKLAASPLASRGDSVTVWTGKQMLVFGGVGPTREFPQGVAYSDGAAYNPSTNTWRKLAPIPRSLGGRLNEGIGYAVWTGKVMLAWGFTDGRNGESLAAATYNPATNRWKTGAKAPTVAPTFGSAFWTGKKMLVWGGVGSHGGFTYDPATRRWASLPASPFGHADRIAMLAAWTGKYLVVGGGWTPPRTRLQKDAAMYNPVTNKWTWWPDAPVGFEGNDVNADPAGISTGRSVIAIEDGVPGGRPLTLDLATLKWSLGPKAPVPGREMAHELWTGQEVLVWGGGVPVFFGDRGGNYCCKTVVQGDGYRP
jgi:N-acetylneuraminic acid mutarotase